MSYITCNYFLRTLIRRKGAFQIDGKIVEHKKWSTEFDYCRPDFVWFSLARKHVYSPWRHRCRIRLHFDFTSNWDLEFVHWAQSNNEHRLVGSVYWSDPMISCKWRGITIVILRRRAIGHNAFKAFVSGAKYIKRTRNSWAQVQSEISISIEGPPPRCHPFLAPPSSAWDALSK